MGRWTDAHQGKIPFDSHVYFVLSLRFVVHSSLVPTHTNTKYDMIPTFFVYSRLASLSIRNARQLATKRTNGYLRFQGARGHGARAQRVGTGPRASADSRKVKSTRKRRILKDRV